jgi:hypothetical protein
MAAPIVIGLALRDDDAAPLALGSAMARLTGAPLALVAAFVHDPVPEPHLDASLLNGALTAALGLALSGGGSVHAYTVLEPCEWSPLASRGWTAPASYGERRARGDRSAGTEGHGTVPARRRRIRRLRGCGCGARRRIQARPSRPRGGEPASA